MTGPKADSLEMRILEKVRDNYPITKDELRKVLGISEAKLELSLKRLETMGYIEYDVLPDKVFIRLRIVPAGPGSRRGKGKKEKRGSGDDDDYSYV